MGKNVFWSKIKALFKWRNLLLFVVAVLLFVQYIQIQWLLGTFSFLQGQDSSFLTEIGGIRETYMRIGKDLMEVREILNLPTDEYTSLLELSEEKDSEQNKDELQLALFKYIDFLASGKAAAENFSQNQTLINELAKKTDLGGTLKMGPVENLADAVSVKITTADSATILYRYYVQKDDGVLYLETYNKTKKMTADKDVFVADQIKFMQDNSKKYLDLIEQVNDKKNEIASTLAAKETADTLVNKKMAVNSIPGEDKTSFKYQIANKLGDAIGKIVLSKIDSSVSLEDLSGESIEIKDVQKDLPNALSKLDTKTFIEKKVEDLKKNIETTLSDEGFKLLLKTSGLKISDKAWEDDTRIYYNIYDKDGNQLSSIVIEKATATVNIVDPKGANSENILFFDPEFKKKTLNLPSDIPKYGDDLSHKDKTLNILLGGKNGNLIDTLIFVHINEETKKVRMVSIPRDLYYEDKKINSYAFYFGMPAFKKVLSQITGYQLDKYVVIDMYAFIDVIDLIGGIDVHLDQALIDPNYKTIDNGKVGTLHYEPGDYHFGGKEALRIARSRKTSSDFSRAERQQVILKALQSKALNLGFGDTRTIYKIAKVILNKTETDLGIEDAITYFFKYKDYEIESNAVLSSGNILYVPEYVTEEDCKKKTEEAATKGEPDPECADEQHAYTLLPKDDNWDTIKWFFKQQFEGKVNAT